MQKQDLSLFSSPFSKKYWSLALRELSSVRMLAVLALLVACTAAVSALYIPVGLNLRVMFSYIFEGTAAMIAGPVAMLPFGVAADLLGFVIAPSGEFFPGYTLSTVLGALIYSLFLYRAKFSLARIAGAKLCVNLFVNAALGSLWTFMLYSGGRTYGVIFTTSLLKNLALFPLETTLMCVFLAAASPVLVRAGLRPPEAKFRFGKNQVIALVSLAALSAAAIVLFIYFKSR